MVERAHPYGDRIGVACIEAKEGRAALAAEPLLAAVLRLPHTQLVLAGHDAERAGCGVGVRRCRRAAAMLAAPAMAVAGSDERLAHLEPDRAAVAATRERQVSHLRDEGNGRSAHGRAAVAGPRARAGSPRARCGRRGAHATPAALRRACGPRPGCTRR